MSDDCPHCHATGFRLQVDEEGVRTAVRCECVERNVEGRLVEAAHIPRRYDHCALDNFEIHHATIQVEPARGPEGLDSDAGCTTDCAPDTALGRS